MRQPPPSSPRVSGRLGPRPWASLSVLLGQVPWEREGARLWRPRVDQCKGSGACGGVASLPVPFLTKRHTLPPLPHSHEKKIWTDEVASIISPAKRKLQSRRKQALTNKHLPPLLAPGVQGQANIPFGRQRAPEACRDRLPAPSLRSQSLVASRLSVVACRSGTHRALRIACHRGWAWACGVSWRPTHVFPDGQPCGRGQTLLLGMDVEGFASVLVIAIPPHARICCWLIIPAVFSIPGLRPPPPLES